MTLGQHPPKMKNHTEALRIMQNYKHIDTLEREEIKKGLKKI